MMSISFVTFIIRVKLIFIYQNKLIFIFIVF